MGIDDVAVDKVTIERLRARIDVLSTLKEGLLQSNKELQEQVRMLKAELFLRDRERDSLLKELNELRNI